MRLPRDIEPLFALAYIETMDVTAAGEKVGILRSPGFFGRALLKRPRVQALVRHELECRRLRLQVDADFVLSMLVQQYVRLRGMLGHDIADLYTDTGSVKPMQYWPDIWRRQLVTEIHTESTYKRSTDGVQAEESRSWDVAGDVTKLKRESTLAIEKELRACLAEIGRHTSVKAFPVPGEKLSEGIVALSESIDRAISAGRQRAAQRLPATVDSEVRK